MNFEQIATETDDELQRLGEKWFSHLEQTDLTNPQNCFRTGLLKLAYSYSRLVALSYGFQHVFGKNHARENPFLMRVSLCRFLACGFVADGGSCSALMPRVML